MIFPLEKFERFCSYLIIDSKDYGLVPLKLNGAQRYLIAEITAGLAAGIHHFVILKARQLGISTGGLALDLFWQFNHPGMQGALVVDKEKTRDQFRATLDAYLAALPPRFKIPTIIHNRNQLVLANRSRLAYLIASGRQAGSLARGAGLSFVHATECSSYNNQEGVASLMASMAEKNPQRLAIFESTARGFNLFYDMWKDAKHARSIHPIFIGWWRKEDYSLRSDETLYAVYSGKLSGEERRWAREVKKLYGFDLTLNQWAWWRWKLNEHFTDKSQALAEFPFFEDQAFVLTGEQFFDLGLFTQMYKECVGLEFSAFHYSIGTRFEETRVQENRGGELSVWEEPVDGARYVISADPAYGESDNADHFCVQVLKASAEGLEQVAEYNTPNQTMYGFAWVIAHLCGAYSSRDNDPLLILELNGPGRGVLQELLRMPAQYSAAIHGLSEGARTALSNLFGSIQHFLYKRPDTFSSSRLLQWQTDHRTKTLMMNQLRDMLSRGMLKVKSPGFIEEARFITQEGSRIGGQGHRKDDRVITMAMACVAWSEQMLPMLMMQGETGSVKNVNAVSRVAGNYLKAIMEETAEREADNRWLN